MVHQEIGAKDVVAIVKRRFLLILLLAVIGGAAGYAAARILPKRYTSKTLVLVQQPEAQPVTPITTDNVNQRLATMQQLVRLLVVRKGGLTDEEYASFLFLGVAPRQMIETIGEIAHCTVTNFTNRLAHTPLDSFLEA